MWRGCTTGGRRPWPCRFSRRLSGYEIRLFRISGRARTLSARPACQLCGDRFPKILRTTRNHWSIASPQVTILGRERELRELIEGVWGRKKREKGERKGSWTVLDCPGQSVDAQLGREPDACVRRLWP